MKFVLSLLLLLPLLALAQAVPAGRVEQVEGDVRVYDNARTMRVAKVGDMVHEGDSVVTGADGEVHLAMEDDGQIAVRPNTRMRIAKYKADGGNGDTSVIALVQGALRSVTGWIGKYNPKGYVIRTPTATIGVRGTDHETMVLPEGSREGDPGTYDKVNHGATLLSTSRGQTEVRPNQAGYVGLSGKARPQLLKSVPGFFRPQRLDGHFQNLHESVRQRIDQRRSERIETLKTRREALRSDLPAGGREKPNEVQRERRDRGEGSAAARQQRLQERRERNDLTERERPRHGQELPRERLTNSRENVGNFSEQRRSREASGDGRRSEPTGRGEHEGPGRGEAVHGSGHGHAGGKAR